MSDHHPGREKLDEVVAARTEREVSAARIINSIIAHCDWHGFDDAVRVLDEAKLDLYRRRADADEILARAR